jgi:hypothetical protein
VLGGVVCPGGLDGVVDAERKFGLLREGVFSSTDVLLVVGIVLHVFVAAGGRAHLWCDLV